MGFTRRNMLASTGAAAAMTFTRTALGGWEPSARYPDPAIQILDPAFAKYRIAQASVERLATGMRWCEGPVYFGDARCLLWSDIPNNRIMRWDEGTGRVSVYRTPSNNANGNTRDRQGRLVTCEHDSTARDAHRIRRHDHGADGQVRRQAAQLAERHRGQVRRLDLVHRSALRHSRQLRGPRGHARIADQRLPPRSEVRARDGGRPATIDRPNGLAFSPDEKKLYVVESGLIPRVIRVYDVNDDKLANGRGFITAEPGGTPDGFRCDVDGNLWCGWGMGSAEQDGVKIFDPSGKPIGFIALPERCANVCFGGVKRNRLFMAASHSVYSLYVNTQGAPGG